MLGTSDGTYVRGIERYDELYFNRILKTNQYLFSVILLFQI